MKFNFIFVILVLYELFEYVRNLNALKYATQQVIFRKSTLSCPYLTLCEIKHVATFLQFLSVDKRNPMPHFIIILSIIFCFINY